MAFAPKNLVVVTDNTMGIPGGEIDDGLALLYLLGCPERAHVEALCATHGNDTTERTYGALCGLVRELGLEDVPVLRGAAAGDASTSDAAREIVRRAQEAPGGVTLVSLGATTDLAAAERLAPGTLARYESVCLMGGVTKPLVFGGRIMDELNLSVDARATYEVLASTRSGAHLRIADAHDCLPLTFDAPEFLLRLARADMPGAGLLRRLCAPWFEKAHADWGIQGFVGWDVLAAVAAATPELVDFVPFHLALYERFFRAGLLFEVPPTDDVPSVDVELVRIRDGKILAEHVYRTWHRALEEHFG